MNILCLHPVLSMRAVKEMAAVKEEGHRVILAYEGVGSSASIDKGDFWDKIIELPKSKSRLEFRLRRLLPIYYRSALEKIVKEERIDLIHVFSMPDHLAVASIKYAFVPVIYDVRDLTTGMNTTPFFKTNFSVLDRLQEHLHRFIEKRLERFVCKNANGIVCVSESMADKIIELYGVKREKVTFLESYPNKDNIPQSNNKKLSENGEIHLVYAGNIFFDGYENSLSFFRQIADLELHIHIYPAGGGDKLSLLKKEFVNNTYIHINKPVSAKDLLLELTKYDYGLVLYSPKNDELNRSLTISNKLLESLACGVPVASTDMEATRRFLYKHNAGFVFTDATDLAMKAKELINSFSFNQNNFVMETHVNKLLKLYEEAVIVY